MDSAELTGLIDSHMHLLPAAQRSGLSPDALCSALFDNGLFFSALAVCLGDADAKECKTLQSEYPRLLLSYGLGPWEAGEKGEEKTQKQIDGMLLQHEALLNGGGFRAVGEAGLDYYWDYGTRENQRLLFQGEIELARKCSLPLIVHSRDAGAEVTAILKTADLPAGGVIHCCSFKSEYAGILLDKGFFLSFAGNLTFKNADDIRQTCVFCPRDRLLLETDAPYLSPVPKRGLPNTSLNMPYIYDFAAQLRNTDKEELARSIRDNYVKLFRIKDF